MCIGLGARARSDVNNLKATSIDFGLARAGHRNGAPNARYVVGARALSKGLCNESLCAHIPVIGMW
jgi:hypothetical protein